MLEIIGALFSSILAGGATGIFGVVVQRWADFKNKQLDIEINKSKFAHEIEMRRVDAEILAQEWAGRLSVAETEAAGRSDVAESQAFAQSFNEPAMYSANVKASKNQGWVLVALDFIRGVVRPGLTVYLCILTTLIYMQAYSLIGGELPPADALPLVKMIVGTVLYLTTTCVLWWFGTRNKGGPPKFK